MKHDNSAKKTLNKISSDEGSDLEEALLQSEASYHGLFNTIRQAIYIQDHDGRFVEVNDGACAMYGYTRQEFIGRTPEFLSAPGLNDFEFVTEKIRQAFAGEPQQLEFWGRRKNGEIFPKDVRLYKGTYFGNDVLIVVATDITGQKRAEKALHESEEYYRAIINTSPDNITITDLSGKILMGSLASVAMFKLSGPDAANGRKIIEFIVPEERARVRQALALIFKTGAAMGEYHGIRTDGSVFPFEAHMTLMRDSRGNPWRLITVVRDISNRRELEEKLSSALARSKEQQQVIADIAISPLVYSGEVEELARMITEKSAPMLGVERVSVWIYNSTETRLVCIDLFETTPRTHTSGTILLESEFRNEFNALKEAKFINADDPQTDPRTSGYVEGYLKPLKITSMLDAVVRSAGKNIGLICFEHVENPHIWEQDECAFACQLADQIALAVTNREREMVQKALVKSDERYRTFISHSNEGIFRFEAGCDISVNLPENEQIALFVEHGYLAECNDTFARMYAYNESEDLIGVSLCHIMEIDSHVTFDFLRTFIRSGYRIENYETVEKDQYGHIRGFLNSLTGTISDGKFVRLWGVQRDITDHKKADQQLAESEKRYRRLIEAVTDYIYSVRMENGRAVETIHGPGCEAITGYTTLDFSRDPDLWLRMVVKEDRHAVIGLAEKILSGGEVQAIEHRIIHKDGQVRWVRNTPVLRFDGEGRLVTYDCLIQDITTNKMAEEALKESEERYSSLFSNNYSVSLIIDPDTGRIVNANDAAAWYYGYSRDQILALGIQDLNRLPPDKIVRDLKRAKDEKEKHFFSTHYRVDGEKRYVEIYSGPIKVQGKPLFYSIIHDVTDSRLAALALKESEERYRTLVDQLPDYVLVHRNGILLYVNPSAALNLGYDAENLIGNPVFPLIAPEFHTTVRQAIIRRMAGEIIPSYEMKIRAADGTFRTVLTNGAAITFEGKPASLNVLTDISTLKQAEETIRSANEVLEKRVAERTEALSNANVQLTAEIAARTRAEEEITRSLEEKVILLREIHHRVKNNLQIIASLLNLQSRYITDPKVLESIKDSQSRVRAMALAHERIYRSHNLSDINLKDYLNYLTKQILQFYNVNQYPIGISVTMDAIMADIDTVIPVGLILNELVSNSLKHAFPDGRKGTISIEGFPEDANTFRFVYHDDGVGMPAGFDWKNTESLGLRLVNSLVDQLDGTLESCDGEGTTFIITIQLKRDPALS